MRERQGGREREMKKKETYVSLFKLLKLKARGLPGRWWSEHQRHIPSDIYCPDTWKRNRMKRRRKKLYTPDPARL